MRNYLEDIMILTGLVLLGWGGWQYSPAICCLVVGGTLTTLAVSAAITRTTKQ